MKDRAPELGKEITPAEVKNIKDESARIFALRCSEIPHLRVKHNVQVGGSVIDFSVLNERRNGSSHETLVETTLFSRAEASEDGRKKRQMKAMQESGLRYIILYDVNIANIKAGLTKKRTL